MAKLIHLSVLLGVFGTPVETADALRFEQGPVSWIDALVNCKKTYSSLVEIHNSAVLDQVSHFLHNNTGDLRSGVWCGLERSIVGPAKWKWVSRRNAEYLQQDDSQPDNKLNNHCGKIVLVKDTIRFRDANCHDKLPFVCQESPA